MDPQHIGIFPKRRKRAAVTKWRLGALFATVFFAQSLNAQDAAIPDTLPVDTQAIMAQTRAAEKATPVQPAEVKPQPIMQNGMKFIPIDRKKTLTHPISKNQPAIIRPRSPIITRVAPHRKKDEAEQTDPIRIDNNHSRPTATQSTTSGDAVLDVFPTDESKP